MSTMKKRIVPFIFLFLATTLSLAYAQTAFNFTWTDVVINKFTSLNAEDIVLTPTGLLIVTNVELAYFPNPINNATNYQVFDSSAPYYSGIIVAERSVIYGGDRNLYLWKNLSKVAEITTDLFQTTGLAYDRSSDVLYACSLKDGRLVAYNSSVLFNSSVAPEPVTICTSSSAPSANTTNNPRKMVLDKNGGLWLVDTSNHRLLYFARGSKTASKVIGQINFTELVERTSASSFSHPYGVVLSNDNKIMFVADQYRVLRFEAPFGNGSAATGVLGYKDFLNEGSQNETESTFGTLWALKLDDFGNGQGRLYVLDRGYQRVVSGITTFGTVPGTPSGSMISLSSSPFLSSPPLSPSSSLSISSSPLAPSPSLSLSSSPLATPTFLLLNCSVVSINGSEVCQVTGDVVIPKGRVLVFEAKQVIVSGDIVFSNDSTIRMSAGQTISTLNKADVKGTLILDISNLSIDKDSLGLNLTLLTYGSREGEFEEVQIVGGSGNGNGCEEKVERVEYGLNALVVGLEVSCEDEERDKSGLNVGLIAGVVGGAGGCVLIVLVASCVALAILAFAKRRKLHQVLVRTAQVDDL